jgi:hypothetical protein
VKTYTERILGLLADQDPIRILESGPARLELFLYGCAESDYDLSYESGKWSARQILAHLADVEILYSYRLRQAVAQKQHSIQLIDEQVWAKRYHKLEPSLSLDAFRALRVLNLSLLASFDLQDWLKDVYHPERGVESLDLMLRLWAGHDLNHLLQLDQIAQKITTQKS